MGPIWHRSGIVLGPIDIDLSVLIDAISGLIAALVLIAAAQAHAL